MRKTFLFLTLCAAFFGGAQNMKWAISLGDVNAQESDMVAVDCFGNIYHSGIFNGTVDFDPGAGVFNLTSSGTGDLYVSKLDSLGNFLWAFKMTNSGGINCYAITPDTAQSVIIAGRFWGTVDFDPSVTTSNLVSAGSYDAFICKYDSNGNLLWAKRIGGTQLDECTSLEYDRFGNTYAAGSFNLTVDFDPGAGTQNMTSSGGREAYVLKMDLNGNYVWARKMGGTSSDFVNSVQTDNTGSVFIAGCYSATADMDPGAGIFNLTSSGGTDVFISRLDPSGNFMWARKIGGPDVDWPPFIAVDSMGFIVGSGYMTSTVLFDPANTNLSFSTSGSGDEDIYVFKADPNGNFNWVRQIGGPLSDFSYSMNVDAVGNIYTTGMFHGTVDFDPGYGIHNLVGSGADDGYLLKLNAYGDFVWCGQLGPTAGNTVWPKHITTNQFGDVYAAGYFTGTADLDPTAGIMNIASMGNSDAFVIKLSQGICSFKALTVDSAYGVSCVNHPMGYAHAFVTGHPSPHTFQWNTIPVTNDSFAYFNTGGIYTITYSDSDNCILQSTIVIGPGPDYLSDFDVTANVVATIFRQGVSSTLYIDAYNNGCDSVSGDLVVVLDNLVNYDSASPSPDIISGDTLIWYYQKVTFDSLHLLPQIVVTTPGTAQIGDTVCFDVIIYPSSGDADSLNNFKTYCYPVMNGYDPNVKSVYPQGSCSENYVLNNQKLTYTIQFQNTGNANAININVLDSLDSDLDLNSMRAVAHSHPLITEILPGNVLKFRFDNIQLPDSGSNEALSHGYVIYEVDPLPGKPDGTQIKNHADIYFDFNPAVVTNATLNTLVSVIPICNVPTNTNSVPDNPHVKIYPNPAKDLFTIENIFSNATIKIYDFSGRLVLTQKSNGSKCTIKTNNLQNGIFLVEVSDENGQRSFQRIVINH